MNKEYLIFDSSGIVLVHLGGTALPFDGFHFASLRGLPDECKATIEMLLRESGAADRFENRAVRHVVVDETEYVLRLVETIRIERSECHLKRALGEALYGLALEARESRSQLNIRMDRSVPERVIVDSDKILWATTAVVRNAITGARKGSLLKPGGVVGVEVSFDPGRNLISILVEDENSDSMGESSVSGKLLRAIVEAHGGILVWESVPAGNRMGTRVCFTLPAR
jgi:hypothetical protein